MAVAAGRRRQHRAPRRPRSRFAAWVARRRPPAWIALLVAIPLVGVPYTHVSPKMLESFLLYDSFFAVSAVAVFVAGRRQAAGRRAPWNLAAAAMLAYLLGDLAWYVVEWMTGAPPASASAADIGYLAYYPLLAGCLLALQRRRSAGPDWAGFLDGLIISCGLALIIWVFLVVPNLLGGEGSAIGRAITVGYPVMDSLLLIVVVRLAVTGGRRPPSFYLIAGGIVTMLATDVIYGLQGLAGTYTAGGWLDVGCLAAQGLVASAALHPSAGELAQAQVRLHPRPSRGRLAGLAGAALFAPTLATMAPTPAQRLFALIAAAVIFLLILARLELVNHALARTEARFRSLVTNAADGILVLDATGAITYASPSTEPALDVWDGARGRRFAATVHPDDEPAVTAALRELSSSEAGTSITFTARVLHQRDGWRYVEALATNRLADRSVAGLVINARDVTERAELESQLREAALRDALTGLANRSLFAEHTAAALAYLDHDSGPLAVLFIDLDDFKGVNDSLGHLAGDSLLRTVAARLATCVHPADTVARLGGDEFAVLLLDRLHPEHVMDVAERIRADLDQPILIAGHRLAATGSIGIAFGEPGQDVDALLRNADLAMYEAKRAGKSRVAVFRTELHTRATAHLRLRSDVQHALHRGEFLVHYQPIVTLPEGMLVGAEALVRWRHPQLGLLPPDAFIPLAEEFGLIHELGGWVLEEACGQASDWSLHAPGRVPLTVNVNLSARQLDDPGFAERVRRALRGAALSPSQLVLEVTESVVISDLGRARATLEALHDEGVRLAVDDFGTGLNSMNILQRLPMDLLKIDKSYVAELDAERTSPCVAAAIVNFADSLGLKVIAEGVETAEQVRQLSRLNCRFGQGSYFGRPLRGLEMVHIEAPVSEPIPPPAAHRVLEYGGPRAASSWSGTSPGGAHVLQSEQDSDWQVSPRAR